MSSVGSSVSERVEDGILGRNSALEDALKVRMPFGPGNRLGVDSPAVNHFGKSLPKVAILMQRPWSLTWGAPLDQRKSLVHNRVVVGLDGCRSRM